MFSNLLSLHRKPFLKNVLITLSKFSYKEHLKHDLTQPKAYRRILPSAKKLITEHGILDQHLPDFRIIKKEHILEIVKRLEAKKLSKVEAPPVQAPATPKAPPKKVQPTPPKVNVFDEVSTQKEIDYLLFKNKFPHTYFYQSANFEKLSTSLSELNSNHNKNLKLEDFIAKSVAKLINKNDNLKILYDQSANKFISYQGTKDVHVYLKNFRKDGKSFTEEQFVYLNPHTLVTAEIAKTKKILTEFKEKFTPLIRYNHFNCI
jgi:hypothetical protein